MSEWLSIDSAPWDGTDVLVSVTHNLGSDEWETVQWVDWRREGCEWPVYWSRVEFPFPPTHWMPLPAPPNFDKED